MKPERIVYSHVSGPQFHVTATFAEHGDKTKLTVRMLFDSAAQRDKVAKEFGAVEGLNQTLARLEEELAKMSAAKRSGSGADDWRQPRRPNTQNVKRNTKGDTCEN